MQSWTLWMPSWQPRSIRSPTGPAKQLPPARSAFLELEL